MILWPLCLPVWAFQSTPPARGATSLCSEISGKDLISIHAPREGGDQTTKNTDSATNISIHAPREGGDSNANTKSI